MTNIIKIPADTFNFPTREERMKIERLIPKLYRFDVEHNSAFIALLSGSDFEKAERGEDICWWCECVNNRIGKLKETFIYVQAHFLRIQNEREIESKHTDELLLVYFVEIFYYYFFSTRDVIGQLLNCFYRLGINENYLKVNDNFIERIPSIEIQSSLANFVKKTKDTNVERNAFTHRFTPTSADFRVTKTVKKEKDGVSFYEPENIKIETFVKNSEEMLEHLSDLLSKLTKEVR